MQTSLSAEPRKQATKEGVRLVRIYVENCEDRVGPLYIFLREWFRRVGGSFDIVYLDNGSTDGSTERIEELKKRDRRIQTVRLDGRLKKRDALKVFGEMGHPIFDVDASVAASWHHVVTRLVLKPCA